MDNGGRDNYPFSPGFPPHQHGNEAFRLDSTVSSYSGMQSLPNTMYSQNFTAGGYPFPKYEAMSPHPLLPSGDMILPQLGDTSHYPVAYPSTNANSALHISSGQSLSQSTNPNFGHFSFGNSGIQNPAELNIPQLSFPYPGNGLQGSQGVDLNTIQSMNFKNQNIAYQKQSRTLSPGLQALSTEPRSRSISPHMQGVAAHGRSSPLIDVSSLSNSDTPPKQEQVPWSHQQYGKDAIQREQIAASNHDNLLSSVSSYMSNSATDVSKLVPTYPTNHNICSSPFDLSVNSSRLRENDMLAAEKNQPVVSEKPRNNMDSVHSMLSADSLKSENISPVKQSKTVPDTQTEREYDKESPEKKTNVRFILKGRLARESYYTRFRINKEIMDSSLESIKDEPVDHFSSLSRSLDSTQGFYHLIQNLNDFVFPANNSFLSTPRVMEYLNGSFDKDFGSANKRKMRQPSFHSPAIDLEKKDTSKKVKNVRLNEEYLVKDSEGKQSDSTDDDKKGKQKHPFAITSPSFSKAAARAVMTTSVANNATVVTISIANKANGEKGRTRSVSGSSSALMSPREHGNTDDDEDDDQTSDDSMTRESTAESGTDDIRGEIGIARTPIMPSLRTGEEKDVVRKRLDDNCVIEESADRMEINVRIDDSQLIQHGDIKRWQCHMCSKSYTTKHNLVTHVLDHKGIKPHLCMVCGKYFKQLSHLNTHMLTHDNIKPHVCKICMKGFTQISHLKRHMTVHLESRPYHCDICNRGFAYPSELRAHKERHASEKENKCLDCGEEFDCPKALKQHQVTHGNPDGLTCKYCSKVFRYPSQMRDHVVTHEGVRPFICGECGMDFMKEHHLRSHQFTHSGKKPWACPHCGRAFNQKANMQRHMLIHNSERSYKCEVCGKTFTQPQTLKAHMVVHAEKKPYECKFCGKQFGRLHNLQGHMHMHNDTKPYVCFCGSSFTLKGNLNRHKKVKHGLNETTENMEEDAVNFLSELSERTYSEGREFEEEEEASEHSSLECRSPKKARKSVPRKYHKSRTKSMTDDNDGSHSDPDDPKDADFRIVVSSRYFKGKNDENTSKNPDDPDNREESRKRKRKPSRVSQSEEDYSNEFSDSDDDDLTIDAESDEQERPAKKQKSANLDSIIASKFNV